MTNRAAQAKEAIRRCRELRDAGQGEAGLRSEFLSRLRLIFPEPADQGWINHYSEGTEARTEIGQQGGKTASRFIDNLVGSTTIEYEPDLRNVARREGGMAQVREHVAGLVRNGCPVVQVRGILSDTIEWEVYDAELAAGIDPNSCTPEDITLILTDQINLVAGTEASADCLITFVRRHLARQQSRPLTAAFLTLDLGLDSASYNQSAHALCTLVDDGRSASASIMLATNLWSSFVDSLEGEAGDFRAAAYVDEVYLCILARLLSANVLAERAISSGDSELADILDGSYFKDRYRLSNIVEQDYFGWLTDPAYIGRLIPIARQAQHDLAAYDFSSRPEEDLFGRLMAQLARRTERRLLGQEWTPGWLAHQLANRCLDNLPEGELPRIVDMCCGSGSMLAETLKSARERFCLADIASLQDVATGFDINPLAVSLAKTTWVVTLAEEIKRATEPISIPIYHADSLFSVTPITPLLPLLGESDTIPVALDGLRIELPHILFQPEFRNLFDRIIDWAYDEANDAKVNGSVSKLTPEDTAEFLNGAASALGIALQEELRHMLVLAVFALVHRMVELAVAGRNGIWAFILRNTYRPGLLAGRFNGLVSNPPWLALSRIANNPYRNTLTGRAQLYGIRPPGPSFLHLELGTTHFLHAVDRYLAANSSIACLVPGTILNGHHHEPFRRRRFLTAERPVALEISEVWQIEPGTFKYPGAAIIGQKCANPSIIRDREIDGFLARKDHLHASEFSVRAIGNTRTAWIVERAGLPTASTGRPIPKQGADLMPRSAVCIEINTAGGTEYRVHTPLRDSRYGFAVKGAKQLANLRFPGHVAPRFIYRMAQSVNLLPFVFGEQCAPIAIPAVRDEHGAWQVLDEVEIRRMGFIETARRFRAINESLAQLGQGKTLQERIDERGKLRQQIMPNEGHMILAGAGGKHTCGACLPIAANDDLIVDQTLYWRVVSSVDEAHFCVAMLNSKAMTEAIKPFNPRGAFGERHIHGLPHRLMPIFSATNEDHIRIVALSKQTAAKAQETVMADEYLRNPHRALTVRRRRLRNQLQQFVPFQQLEELCASLLDTTSFGQNEA